MPEFTKNLIKDLTELLQNSEEYNISIITGENKNTNTFQAHSFILRARSAYFRRVLSKDLAKKGERMILKKPNISSQIFRLILNVIDLDKESGDDILSLLIAADELEIPELIHYAQDYLITRKLAWIQQNLVKIMRTVSIHKLFKKLNEHCLNIISEEPHMIFEANDFLSLEESVLVSILKRDDLGMDEIEIWNSIIKWGTGNTLSLSKEPVSKWTPENFAALEKTLHQCIPLIRYSDISSTDYFEKVMPYRKIIPKDMKTEILGYHLKDSTPQPIKILPPRSGSFDSKIINLKHTKLISSWIDKKNTTNYSCKSQYEFKLLYRGSRDGFEATKFRQLCGTQTRTVVVVKISETGKIIGGYNPTNWVENINYGYSYLNAPDAFIFSFDKNDLQSAKISRNNSGNQIAYRYNNYQVDDHYFNENLYISDNCNLYASSWYYHRDMEESQVNFKVDEYEVFQIVPKDHAK